MESISRKKKIILGIIFGLSIILAFGIGYISAGKQNIAPIIIQKCSEGINL